MPQLVIRSSEMMDTAAAAAAVSRRFLRGVTSSTPHGYDFTIQCPESSSISAPRYRMTCTARSPLWRSRQSYTMTQIL